jgi:uncharacterized protein
MIGIDTNILLYSLNPSSKFHVPAVQFLNQCLGDRTRHIAIADYVLVELYNNLRNQVVMRHPLTPRKATEIVKSYWQFQNVSRIEYAPVMDKVWEYASGTQFARRRIFDVRLALTLQYHGVDEFVTANVKDFEQLGFRSVWNPVD